MIKSVIPFIRLTSDMAITYFIVFWLMFYSGLFYYPESHKWAIDVVLISLVTGIILTIVTVMSVYTVNECMKNDPNNGGYLVLTIAVSLLVVTLLAVRISQEILHYYILMGPNLVGVFIYIIYPLLFLVFIFRADKHL